MDLTCLGEFLIDLFPAETGRRLQEVSAFRPVPGGAPANVAVAAARLGRRSAFVGKVGDDAFGHLLADVLAREQVSTRGLRFDPAARTTLAFIALPTPTTAEFLFYRNPGADLLLDPGELDLALLEETRALHIGSISLIGEPSRSATVEAVRVVRRAGGLVSFDVNYRPGLWPDPETARDTIGTMLPSADLLKVNETELELLTGTEDLEAGSRMLLDRGPAACVVTLGAGGSFFRAADGFGSIPGFVVPVVDAVGCGDAFIAALLSQLLEAADPRGRLSASVLPALLRYANAAGALTAQHQGVIPALPTAAQVQVFLEEHPV